MAKDGSELKHLGASREHFGHMEACMEACTYTQSDTPGSIKNIHTGHGQALVQFRGAWTTAQTITITIIMVNVIILIIIITATIIEQHQEHRP